MKKNRNDVSIIIVNYKSWKALKKCLSSINDIYFNSIQFEVIIVDNFSDDGIIAEFSESFPRFKFLINTNNNGFSHACNIGSRFSNGKFLLFLNPDTLTTKDTLKTLYVTALNNPELKLISCNKVNSKGKLEKINKPFPSLTKLFGVTRALLSNWGSHTTKTFGKSNKDLTYCSWLSGSLILMSRHWYNKLGGWNEDYWLYYEDVDLSKRTEKLQGKIAIINNLSIIHNHGGATRINTKTKGLTKTEAIISKHIYINNNFSGIEKNIAQIVLVISLLISKTFLFSISLALYFIPKLHVNIYIFKNLISYYHHAFINKTWLSTRSVNFDSL
ncbi:MAG: glycosyltransferase [Proteobacteria bacterium]|nr:glycosyltransferase [Pseudomonadota bacterium]